MNTDIRLAVGYFRHRKTKRLRRLLGDAGVIAHLNLLCYVGEFHTDGTLFDMDAEEIEEAAGWQGEPGVLVSTLCTPVSYLDEVPGKGFKVHDWADWNGYAAHAKDRSASAKKAAEARWSKRCAHADECDPQSDPHAEGNAPSPTPDPDPTPAPGGLKKKPPSPSDPVTASDSKGSRPRTRGRVVYPPEFEEAWSAYPSREGGASKSDAVRAWSARRRGGHEASVILAGVERYAAYCEARGIAGTPMVKMPATFFGPSDPPWFSQSWDEGTGGGPDMATRTAEIKAELRAEGKL